MTNEEIFKLIQKTLAKKLELQENEISQISRETTFDDLANEYDFDSLERIEFVMDIERQCHISIPDDEVEWMKNLDDMTNCFEKRLPH